MARNRKTNKWKKWVLMARKTHPHADAPSRTIKNASHLIENEVWRMEGRKKVSGGHSIPSSESCLKINRSIFPTSSTQSWNQSLSLMWHCFSTPFGLGTCGLHRSPYAKGMYEKRTEFWTQKVRNVFERTFEMILNDSIRIRLSSSDCDKRRRTSI